MPELRGITVCVGEWYAKLLAITLPRNMRHLADCVVVTTPDDAATAAVVGSVPGVRLSTTDAFYRHGATFNKGLSLEEGFDVLGRHGWHLIWDADILFPDHLPHDDIASNKLYGAKRRILENPAEWTPDYDWRRASVANDNNAPLGFFQLFHADDPALASKRPWYSVDSPHAGRSDAYFLEHWPRPHRQVLPIECLHLGPRDRHWWGTTPEAIDKMAAYSIRSGWNRGIMGADRTALERVEELPERLEVPGYETSSYLMPFERRAKVRQATASRQDQRARPQT